MANRFLTNFDAFTAALLHLPDELAGKAEPLVVDHAERAAADVKAAYPRITGTLQDGVVTHRLSTPNGRVAVRVQTKAFYAIWYDLGNGRQRPRPTFIPITRREQSALLHDLVDMVRAEGFTVSGEHA